MYGLTASEMSVFKTLDTPQKIQDFLDEIEANYEASGDTLYSPRMVLRERKAHCIEGALFAALALWINGHKPIVMSLHAVADD